MFQVMAHRLHEEEQSQLRMVALKEMTPFYPGRSHTEVQSVLQTICGDFSRYESSIASFWMTYLDNRKRKELLVPVKEAVKSVLHSYWRRVDLSGIRLNKIISRLLSFLLTRRGEGLWSTISSSSSSSSSSPSERKSSWETQFKKKCNGALSVVEITITITIIVSNLTPDTTTSQISQPNLPVVLN